MQYTAAHHHAADVRDLAVSHDADLAALAAWRDLDAAMEQYQRGVTPGMDSSVLAARSALIDAQDDMRAGADVRAQVAEREASYHAACLAVAHRLRAAAVAQLAGARAAARTVMLALPAAAIVAVTAARRATDAIACRTHGAPALTLTPSLYPAAFARAVATR